MDANLCVLLCVCVGYWEDLLCRGPDLEWQNHRIRTSEEQFLAGTAHEYMHEVFYIILCVHL